MPELAIAATGLCVLVSAVWLGLTWPASRLAHRVLARARSGRRSGIEVSGRTIIFRSLHPDQNHPILFLHGFGMCDPNCYAGFIQLLREKGFTVYYPVYPRSFVPFGQPSALLSALDGSVNDWAQWCRLVVGHSQGASLAVDLVAKRLLHNGGRLLLICPGEGARSDGTALVPGMRLPWGKVQLAHPAVGSAIEAEKWSTLIVSVAGDQLVGRLVADKIALHLGQSPRFWVERQHHVPIDELGRPGHYFLNFGVVEPIDAEAIRRLSGPAWQEVGANRQASNLVYELVAWCRGLTTANDPC